ncbi:Dps family protein [Mycoplasmopsis verecunda]|uniref:Starvation-inducible DNA-binding protein n=1 Tax=Mycoplasmopsis verecunda TaxID=171291 RepID=A0A1T4LWN1_9BACT|nr:DNA starvation/stationary phase protection protein [Mycoplasmopsis verecunda]WPB54576.1 DNA starvation/stationary phase protection protein [Mycoplasmopsis verecunda]SJZ58888.1 starvation-inducible DNA-binding protein [Mycoplasmopsis verecunda]
MNNKQDLLKLQASFLILQTKVKNFHWNLKDKNFFEIHEQLDKFYDDVSEQLDALAEKLLMLDHNALGSYKDSLDLSLIQEAETQYYSAAQVFEAVVYDLEKILDFIGNMKDISFRVQPLIDEVVIMVDTWLWKFKKSM